MSFFDCCIPVLMISAMYLEKVSGWALLQCILMPASVPAEEKGVALGVCVIWRPSTALNFTVDDVFHVALNSCHPWKMGTGK